MVVSRNTDEETRLPSAHTCFNHLLLPEYKSLEVMRERSASPWERLRASASARLLRERGTLEWKVSKNACLKSQIPLYSNQYHIHLKALPLTPEVDTFVVRGASYGAPVRTQRKRIHFCAVPI